MVSPLSAERLKDAKFLQLDWGGPAGAELVSSKGMVFVASPCSKSESASPGILSMGMAADGESLRVSAARDWTSSAVSSW